MILGISKEQMAVSFRFGKDMASLWDSPLRKADFHVMTVIDIRDGAIWTLKNSSASTLGHTRSEG